MAHTVRALCSSGSTNCISTCLVVAKEPAGVIKRSEASRDCTGCHFEVRSVLLSNQSGTGTRVKQYVDDRCSVLCCGTVVLYCDVHEVVQTLLVLRFCLFCVSFV